MPKLDLSRVIGVKIAGDEISRMKGPGGFLWRKPPGPTVTMTVTGGEITEFRRSGVDFTQVLWRQGGSLALSGDVDAQWALVGGGGSGGSIGQSPGGGGVGAAVVDAGVLEPGTYEIIIGAGGAGVSSGPGNSGSLSEILLNSVSWIAAPRAVALVALPRQEALEAAEEGQARTVAPRPAAPARSAVGAVTLSPDHLVRCGAQAAAVVWGATAAMPQTACLASEVPASR